MTATALAQAFRSALSAFRSLRNQIKSYTALHPRRTRGIAIALLFPAGGVVAAFGFAPLAPDAADLPVQQIEVSLADVPIGDQVQQLDLADTTFRREAIIERSDTIGTLLVRLGVDDRSATDFIRSDPNCKVLGQLRAGKSVFADVDNRGSLVSLRFPFGQSDNGDGASAGTSDSLLIERHQHTYTARVLHEPNQSNIEMRFGEISSSLYGATDSAGVPEQIAGQIAEIFSGEIDFYRDLRRGDRFRVVYENFGHDGASAHPGRVLAVEFVTQGKVHQAVWYQPHGQSGAYYGFDGRSMRRAFLRAPLEFTRISSGFGGRVHPILNIWKWHTGIDYAAPIGTPIRATADGLVKFVGQQTGYGNAIELKHQGVYSTLYGHMSAFAKGIKAGQTVTQGQVIGFVGMTGWATGPHLHYEFRVDGVAKDPLRVVMPDAVPVARDQMAAFKLGTTTASNAIVRMRNIDSVSLAVPHA